MSSRQTGDGALRDRICAAIAEEPLSTADIAEKANATSRQVTQALAGLKSQGRVRALGARGAYRWTLPDGPLEADAKPARKRASRKPPQAAPEVPADTDDTDDTPEIFVGRFSSGDVQIGVGDEALRMPYAAARQVHALLFDIFTADEGDDE
ncbi:MAG: hypothetical protein MUF80_10340 [Burkholderiales bacterium]|jgi:hypothetical protein|nr:hypothetical protein [Burkholderiales bacterium]